MSKDPFKEYKKHHWGDDRTLVVRVNNSKIKRQKKGETPRFTGMGRLMEFRLSDSIDEIKSNKQPKYTKSLIVKDKFIDDSHLVFDPNHKYERLYIGIPKEVKDKAKKIYKEIKEKPIKLASLAKKTKGRHSTKDYQDVLVKSLGYITDVVYKTYRNGHGLSHYIHAFGEPYKKGEKWTDPPILAVDRVGNLWIVGGNYRCVPAGIIN